MLFRYKLQLPPGVVGELVLIQWYYVASNTGCSHEGYDSYEWPEEWIYVSNREDEDGGESGGGGSAWDQKMSVGTGLKPCSEVLSKDGNGIPEQFWGCAVR